MFVFFVLLKSEHYRNASVKLTRQQSFIYCYVESQECEIIKTKKKFDFPSINHLHFILGGNQKKIRTFAMIIIMSILTLSNSVPTVKLPCLDKLR